ncbi:sigma factor-like helix-turn-helix DNA-binding protein, partial [Kitasatospora herbaricolor]
SVPTAAPLLLERLSPPERTVFLLREVSGFEFEETAAAVQRSQAACRQLLLRTRQHIAAGRPQVERSQAACRQLLVRAPRHMAAGRPRSAADRQEHQEPAARFPEALKDGDVNGLRQLPATDVQPAGDGGDRTPQPARAVTDAQRVARLLATLLPRLLQVQVTLEQHEVNGQPDAILRDRQGRIPQTIGPRRASAGKSRPSTP